MTSTNKIQEKIDALEAQKEKLLMQRKEEIFNILKEAGGLAIDNKLLAGFATYVSKNSDGAAGSSNFLKEIYDLGGKKIPSQKRKNNSQDTSKSNSGDRISADAN